jgi:hypothetical protein
MRILVYQRYIPEMDYTLISSPQRVIAALSGNLPTTNAASPKVSQETYLKIRRKSAGCYSKCIHYKVRNRGATSSLDAKQELQKKRYLKQTVTGFAASSVYERETWV